MPLGRLLKIDLMCKYGVGQRVQIGGATYSYAILWWKIKQSVKVNMGSKVKMSGSNDTLKIFNEHSSTVLKDLLVDFEHTILLTASNDSLTIVGYGENNICIVPALNPDKAEVRFLTFFKMISLLLTVNWFFFKLFNFENRVVTCDCQPNEIVVLLVFNKVIHISYKY